MKGELDDCMEWPFDKRICFPLIYQDDKNRCLSMYLMTLKKNEKTHRFILENATLMLMSPGYSEIL